MKIFILNKDGSFREKDMKKQDFVKKFSLNIRDLRPVYSKVQVVTILQRGKVLIINLGFIKAILSNEQVYFLQHFQSESLEIFLKFFKSYNIKDIDNFYLFILEKILDRKSRQMREKISKINNKAEDLLPKIKNNISDHNLIELLYLKKKVSKIETRLKEIREAVREILDDSNEFADLVSISSNNNKDDFEEAESILENFIEQIEDYIGNMFSTKEDVQDTEEYINLKLSSRRTIIGKFDLIATIVTLGFSFLAVIVGLFGVNIKNHLENNEMAFMYLSFILFILFITIMIIIFYYLKKKKVF